MTHETTPGGASCASRRLARGNRTTPISSAFAQTRKSDSSPGRRRSTRTSGAPTSSALDAARQEFASIPADDEHRLIVAGDFLEDDDVHEFVRDRALTSQARARVLAADLRAERGFVLPRATLCLGRLESRDFLPLPEERKAAVQAFWVEYLSDKGKAPELHIDGTGLLSGTGGCSGNAQRASTNSKQNGGEP